MKRGKLFERGKTRGTKSRLGLIFLHPLSWNDDANFWNNRVAKKNKSRATQDYFRLSTENCSASLLAFVLQKASLRHTQGLEKTTWVAPNGQRCAKRKDEKSLSVSLSFRWIEGENLSHRPRWCPVFRWGVIVVTLYVMLVTW